MNLNQLFLIFQARYRVILFSMLGAAFVAFAISLMMPKRYTATASVVVDVKSPDPVAGMTLPAMTMPGYMATQVDIINSDRVAYGVIHRLGLDKDPELLEKWREKTDGQGTFESWYSGALQSKLEVKPSHDSNVVNISFKAPNAKVAADTANAFANAYIATNIDLRTEPARQYASWFDEQGKALRQRLEEAQTRLSDYQQKHGIVASDQRIDYENQKLNDLQTQVVLAETASADASSKQHGGPADSTQDAMQSPIVQQLKTEIAMQEARLQEAAGRLGPNHPQYQSMKAQVAALQSRLGAEVGRIQTSIDTSRRVNQAKVAALQAAIEAQKKNVLALRAQMDEMAVLQHDVDSARKAYDTVADRFNQSNLESRSTQTNISVLSPASAPLLPSSPRIFLNTLAAALVGMVLGIVAAIILELRDRRIRSIDDLEYVLGMPVLATMAPLPRPAVGLLPMRPDLVRHAPSLHA